MYDVKEIEDMIVCLKKLQRETRRSIKTLREYQKQKELNNEKGEINYGIAGKARRGLYRK
mgnify:CR=1 FL=1